MENSHLCELIRTFSPIEAREVLKFLKSPFFNQRTDVLKLFEWLLVTRQPTLTAAWEHLFAQRPFQETTLRLVMSYLHRLLEQYLSVKEVVSNEPLLDLHLARAYRRRRMLSAFERVKDGAQKKWDKNSARDQYYLEARYQLQWEDHQLTYTLRPTDVTRLHALSEAADAAFLARKLQIICLTAAHQNVYTTTPEGIWQEEVIAKAETPEFTAMPAIAVFLYCYYMLRSPQEEDHFRRFKERLLLDAHKFPSADVHGLYILAINYCVRQINAGHTHYYGEALEMYKRGLSDEYLMENGVLSRFSYGNIVAAALQAGELDWAEQFIEQYKNKLEKQYRDSSYSYNLARVEFAKGRYGPVLDLLQRANYRDPLLNLGAKTLLLKTCYELRAFDLLESHIDAMRNYIHRKRVLGYHRTNYLNIIRYMEKLMRLPAHDKTAMQQIAAAVQAEEVLSEKPFFLKALS